MRDCLDFLDSPLFHNYFGSFDKKLRKNIIKRCVVEPLIELVFCSPGEAQKSEIEETPITIAPFIKDEKVMDILIEVLSKVVRDGVTTDTLCERLAPSLRIFLRIVKNIDGGESLIQISSGSTPLNSSASDISDFNKKHEAALAAIKTYIMKSEAIDLDIDLDNIQ
jgi:hypothetical protein